MLVLVVRNRALASAVLDRERVSRVGESREEGRKHKSVPSIQQIRTSAV